MSLSLSTFAQILDCTVFDNVIYMTSSKHLLSLLSIVLLLSFLNVNNQYKIINSFICFLSHYNILSMHLLYKQIECISHELCYILSVHFRKPVVFKLCSAEPSSTGNSQGSHKHISFIVKLVKLIFIIFNCFLFSTPSLCIISP